MVGLLNSAEGQITTIQEDCVDGSKESQDGGLAAEST